VGSFALITVLTWGATALSSAGELKAFTAIRRRALKLPVRRRGLFPGRRAGPIAYIAITGGTFKFTSEGITWSLVAGVLAQSER